MCVSTDGNSTPPGCIENCANDPLSQLMTIKVETGKVYFLRFIQSNWYVFIFVFDVFF